MHGFLLLGGKTQLACPICGFTSTISLYSWLERDYSTYSIGNFKMASDSTTQTWSCFNASKDYGGVINEYYFINGIDDQTPQGSGSPFLTFSIVFSHYVGMKFTNWVHSNKWEDLKYIVCVLLNLYRKRGLLRVGFRSELVLSNGMIHNRACIAIKQPFKMLHWKRSSHVSWTYFLHTFSNQPFHGRIYCTPILTHVFKDNIGVSIHHMAEHPTHDTLMASISVVGANAKTAVYDTGHELFLVPEIVLTSALLRLYTLFRNRAEVAPALIRGMSLDEFHCIRILKFILNMAMHETIQIAEDVVGSAEDLHRWVTGSIGCCLSFSRASFVFVEAVHIGRRGRWIVPVVICGKDDEDWLAV